MILVHQLSKYFGNTLVLDDVNVSFPRYGIVVIYGPSGCGKTTLLNCLSGLIPYKGSINVDSTNIEILSEKQMSDFRLKNYGFIFQDYKLFENETVNENILFPLKSISNLSKEKLNRKCQDLMEIVGISSLNKQFVKNLSGGEKQRVCIARALVNDPKIILADEPTGALDSENGNKIMHILSEISKKALVVIVSHDKDLCDKYADEIIMLKDGKVDEVINCNKKEHQEYLPIMKNNLIERKQNLPWDFLFRHSFFAIKQRKWRTVFCNMITSLGLIGVGLAISLSSTISSSIKKAYSSLLQESSLIVSLGNESKSIYGEYAGSYYEAQNIQRKYSKYIVDLGVTYIANFEEFFPDANNLALANTVQYRSIDGISIRNVNEFQWLDQTNDVIYPRKPLHLEDDQIVLGLNIDMINNLCFNLQIERTVSSLSKYILHNDMYVYFDLANLSWQYEDQQIFTVVGFSLVKNPCIYHTNPLWNQYVYEECMRFPTIDNLVETVKYPWVMKKIPYFYLNDDIDEFLSLIRKDEFGDDYIFEIANSSYYPWMLLGEDVKDIRRVLFFSNTLAHIPLRYTNYFEDLSGNIINPIFANNSGFSIYSNALMSGFSRPMYFSFNKGLLEDTLETFSELEVENNESAELPNEILLGHYSRSMSNGVGFKPIENQIINGRLPLNLDEIVVSKGMIDSLKGKIGDQLSISYLINQRQLANGKIISDYKTVEVKVVGYVNEDKNYVYHNADWTISFFQSRLGVSAFNLQTNAILFSVIDDKSTEKTIEVIKKNFPQYDIIDPLLDVNQSIDEVCGYITIALIAFSVIAVLISIILLSITNYLHILETRKEIALARCIGINKKQSKKFLLSYSFVMCTLSFSLSSVELIGVSIFTSIEIANIISGDLKISINPWAILAMFLLSFSISTISSLIISRRINRFNPIEALSR